MTHKPKEDIKIIDDFLFDDYFNELKDLVYSTNFPWFFATRTTFFHEDRTVFSHVLYENSINSNYFSKFEPIKYFINKHMECKNILRLKLNLYPSKGQRIKHRKHHDWLKDDKPIKNIKVGILNFTNCSGATVVGEQEIQSKENQVFLFDNEQAHYGISQDDKSIRVVLNMVFE